jgi:exopolysaccharide production protein ExoZ
MQNRWSNPRRPPGRREGRKSSVVFLIGGNFMSVRPAVGVARDGTYQSIQALRGVAAILVTVFHAASHFDDTQMTLRVGNAGVDIFFVISGFVMWATTARRPPTARIFLRHRLVRLVPLYYLFTFALLAAWAVFTSSFPHMRPPTLQHVLLSLAFVPHLDPDGHIFPVLAQGWTLNFEMFFYLLFALALILPRRWRLASLALILVVLPVLGLAVTEAMARAAPPLVLLSPLLAEFLCGVLICQAVLSGWRPGKLMCWAALAAGGGLLALLPNPAADNDWARLLLFGGPAALIVAGAVGVEVGAENFGVGRLPLLLGASSYSLYLSHTFTLSAMGKLWPHSGAMWSYTVAATAASVAVAILVFWLLERPLLQLFRRPRAPALAAQAAQS